MYEEYFSRRLAQLREQKQVSAREMSLSLGQNESYINRIENQHAFPSMQVFFYICEYLEITPQEFFDVDNSAPSKANQLSSKLKGLTPEQIKAVDQIVTVMRSGRFMDR